ncbi:MAG: right-handed parallel beta-helix repeat-containing protein [Bacteroidales bacterium]|nr:right-handed parallel beta-helix repeat-containing protein [Bacteroidales bacterium]
MKKPLFLILLTAFFASCSGRVSIAPAPEGEPLSASWKVKAAGLDVPVFDCKVASGDKESRRLAMDDKVNSGNYFEVAAFAYFDLMKGSAAVEVTSAEDIREAKVLPESAGIIPSIRGNKLSFKVSRPLNLTVEVNGDIIHSLHIFVNPPEKDVPSPDDPDVIYYAPGIHDLWETVEVGEGKTVYVAPGAILRWHNWEEGDGHDPKKSSGRCFRITGDNVRFIGRGIIDEDGVHRARSRGPLGISGRNVCLEGVIIRNSSGWTVVVDNTENVEIDNIKLIGFRANSDGIDICGSSHVRVHDCFIRTLDDLIVVKAFGSSGRGCEDILAEKCVLWNEVAHALSIGAELRYPVKGVIFRDCDVIHDTCREWSLRIYHTDSALISDVTFENIRIEESERFISLWINDAVWTSDPERGHIENVTFKDITLKTPPRTGTGVQFLGYDDGHAVDGVRVENVSIAGHRVTVEDVDMNGFVRNVVVE